MPESIPERGNALSKVVVLILGLLIVAGVGYAVFVVSEPPDLVVYAAHDEVHSRPVLEAFAKETGLKVRMIFDTEATKTVGLTSLLMEEKRNPKCDVFWNNELVHTIRLKREKVLEPYVSPAAADIPDEWKDPEGYWTGFGARARILILNTEAAKKIEPDEAKWPKSTRDLLDPKWKGHAAVAEPTAGTTLTHMAYLWSHRGPDFVKDFWTRFRENEGRVPPGNGPVMRITSEGGTVFGFTDTDDFRKAEVGGKPVIRIFPDQESTGESSGDEGSAVPGCVVIPNSVMLIRGGPNPGNGKKLIDYILSKKVEERLAHSDAAQMPVRSSVARPDHVVSAADLKTAEVDWEKVADAVEPFTDWVKEFLGK
ncbi:MAG: extracellular solute-binding protein [Planctomycetota bacterium]